MISPKMPVERFSAHIDPLKTMAPRIIPMTSPQAETTMATTAFDSPFDLPTAPRMRPIGPKKMGKNKKAIAPRMIPAVLNPLPVFVVGELA